MSHKKQLIFDGVFLLLISYTPIIELIKKDAKLLEPPPFHLRFFIYLEYEIDF